MHAEGGVKKKKKKMVLAHEADGLWQWHPLKSTQKKGADKQQQLAPLASSSSSSLSRSRSVGVVFFLHDGHGEGEKRENTHASAAIVASSRRASIIFMEVIICSSQEAHISS